MYIKESILNSFRNVLIVDDEENTRAGMSKLLTAEGFDVQLAVDGNDALSCLRDGSFRLVISDLNMPNLDGIDFLRIVQREHPDVNVIILTAACGTESYIQAMNLGAVEYLCKPLKLDSLKSVMRSLVHRSTAQAQ